MCMTVVRLKSMGKATKTSLSFDVSKDVLMSYCVAAVALCDI